MCTSEIESEQYVPIKEQFNYINIQRMPSRHSKQISGREVFTASEKSKAGVGTLTQRLGVESQLPFGYCGLTLTPAEEAVVSPSGRIYSREAIIEYLLQKTKEIKELAREYELEQAAKQMEDCAKMQEEERKALEQFSASQGVDGVVKRKASEVIEHSDYMNTRQKIIDNSDKEQLRSDLQKVSPWIPQNTPSAAPTTVKEPPKRPTSPFSGEPLRSKDLIPINIVQDPSSNESSGPTRFLCLVSRKTITSQKVVLIKSTGTYMLESIAQELAYPSMTCPITGKRFRMSDIIELKSAASGFAATGAVESSKYRKTIT